jgi:hypothetical protein
MDTFDSAGAAIDAIVQFDREKFADLPEHTQKELTRLAGVGISPVDRIVRTAEALYAERSSLTRKSDKLLVAQLVQFAGLNGWHGLNENGRAQKIEKTMRKAAGESVTIADADVPEPKPEFVAPPTDTPTPSALAAPAGTAPAATPKRSSAKKRT